MGTLISSYLCVCVHVNMAASLNYYIVTASSLYYTFLCPSKLFLS